MWTNNGLSLSYFKVEQLLVDRQGRKLTLHLSKDFTAAIQKEFRIYLQALFPNRISKEGEPRFGEFDTLLKVLRTLYFIKPCESLGFCNWDNMYRFYRWRYHGNCNFEKISFQGAERCMGASGKMTSEKVRFDSRMETTLFWIENMFSVLKPEYNPNNHIDLLYSTKRLWTDVIRASKDWYTIRYIFKSPEPAKKYNRSRYDQLNSSAKNEFACISEEGWYLTYR